MELAAVLVTALGSLVVGVMGGAFGVGGGIFLVPFLTTFSGLRAIEAVGVSLFCVIGTSAAASSVVLKNREANLGLCLAMEPFLVGGAVLAGLVAQRVTEGALLVGFALVILAIGGLFLAQAFGHGLPAPVPPDGPAHFTDGVSSDLPYRPQRVRVVQLLSAIAGVASGLFGIGGGVVTVPLLTQVGRLPIRAAAATASTSLMITAASAASIHFAHGTVRPLVVGAALLGILPGGLLGARLQRHLPDHLMRLVFAGLAAFVAGSILWQLWQASAAESR